MSIVQVPKVGVIGAGSFGTAISNLLAQNTEVFLYTRNNTTVNNINNLHTHLNYSIHHNIRATSSLEEIAQQCSVIYPILPSNAFRSVIQQLSPYLRPYHILIHGTKGFDLKGQDLDELTQTGITIEDLSTMSDIILEETVVRRVGCLSGPNLASEILDGQPTATLVASKYKEVINIGKQTLSGDRFHVFGSHDLLGAELSGALKNVIALGSGLLKGHGYEKNLQGMLISRGLIEMITFGKRLGSKTEAFFGTAGIGDLVTTATSRKSRNYKFGLRLGSGETFEQVCETMPELAEGVRTLKITRSLAKSLKIRVPITEMLYRVIFEEYPFEKALEYLIKYPYDIDVDFI